MKKLFSLFVLGLLFLSGCNDYTAPVAPEGKVILEEFGDLQCPACAASVPLVNKLKDTFGDKLVLRFVNFPLSQHENAFHAAEAAECVRDQGEEEYWQFIDKTYEKQSSLNDETYKETAKEIGLNEEQFAQCLTSGEKAKIVRRDMKEGTARGVSSTPTFFLNGEMLESRKYEVIVKQIDELLDANDGGSNEQLDENNQQ